ncbi:recombinase family protein [Rhodophyticola porphyridii]|uniref:Recombinase family protein n=1 Tax=Rhodophyticola porphyridii TaxID=1852017 RepID=A0A3L9Y1D6_9RHOB|nr:recombinase family protein [Rhodophyticola porphyridii]RMA40897.1 recombinase family protein [Rhodophyticola porphyridii]
MPKTIGYARVSTAEQNLALQVSALRAAGCTEIFEELGVSGAQAERPALEAALGALERGDTLIVWRLDRLGRSLRHLIDLNDELTARGCYFESLTEKIDTSSAMGKFVFHILGAVAELEREIIRERTLAGMAEAAKQGRLPGRPRLAA